MRSIFRQLKQFQLDYWTRCEKALKMVERFHSAAVNDELAKLPTAASDYELYKR